jgi:endonuclease/exonuclease/phosphatase family metal-dependent hydrolase
MEPLLFNVATYNIHECVGTDGKFDPQRIAYVIEELECAILGLQEVTSHTKETVELSQMHFLAKATGLNAFAGPTVIRGEIHYGNLILTKFPILRVDRLDLSVFRREPRGAIHATLEVNDGELHVIVTHLGLRRFERLHQVNWLLNLAENHEPLLILADINEWIPWRRPLRKMKEFFGNVDAPRTFPSRFPILALDRIYARPHSLLTKVEAHASETARLASDHLPVKGSIQFSAESS